MTFQFYSCASRPAGEGLTLPDGLPFTCIVGAPLQPAIVYVNGKDRHILENIAALNGNSVYLALFADHVSGDTGCYVGMTRCGQDRPRLGQHLAYPDLASHIFVIADANHRLAVDDAAVLERFLYAKVTELTGWKMRCGRPRAGGVGEDRFAALMSFGSTALVQMRQQFGLFGQASSREVAMVPRQFDEIIYPFTKGPPRGEEVVLDGFGAAASGVNMGEEGFVVRAGSIIRSWVVPSAPQVNAARRDELLYNGQLLRHDEDHLVLRRDLWRPTSTSAARFVTGSSASASDWRPAKPNLHLVRD